MAGQIDALLHELERHILGGRVERAAAIRHELASLGHPVDAAPTEVETTAQPAPSGSADASVPRSVADTPPPSDSTAAPSAAV